MRIIEHSNDGREYLLVEVPTPFYGAKIWFQNMEYLTPHLSMQSTPAGYGAFHKDDVFDRTFLKDYFNCCVVLVKGYYYRILGLASDVGEDVAGEIVKRPHGNWYFNYMDLQRSWLCAYNSLQSLLRSHSLTPNTTLLIQKQ